MKSAAGDPVPRETSGPEASTATTPPQAETTAAAPTVHPVTIVATTTASTTDVDRASTEQAIRDEFAGMSKYWFDQTGGKVDFQIAKLDWWPGHGVCKDGNPTIRDDAKAESGFVPGPDKHIMELVAAGCTFTGNGSATSSLDSGGNVYIEGFWDGLWAHEFGHNLGFGHASLLDCPSGAVDGATTGPGATCRVQSYDDSFDTMGGSREHSYKGFSTPDQIRAGLLEKSDYESVSGLTDADRTVTLQSRSLLAGKRAVQVTDPLTDTTYTVEMATNDGYDIGDVGKNGDNETYPGEDFSYRQDFGVRVLRADGRGTLQLAAPVDASGVRSTAWASGSTFTSPSGGARVDVVATTATTATLRVRTTQTVTPPAGAPTVTVETATVEGGTVQTVHGSGFGPGEKVAAVIHPGNTAVGTVTADASGTVTSQFTVPASVEAGRHTVALTGQSSGAVGRAGFTVTDQPVSKWPAHAFVPNVPYRLTNAASGYVAAPPVGNAANTQLVQRPGTDSGTTWTINPLGAGYRLQNNFSGRCMDIRADSVKPDAAITQFTCITAADEQWKVLDRPGGGTAIVSVLSGLCLAPSGESTADGKGLVQQNCSRSAAQDWTLTAQVPTVDQWKPIPTPAATPYSFTNAASGLDIGIPTGDKNTRVIQRAAGDSGAQFTLKPNANGSYALKNVQDKLCVTLIGTGAGAYGFTYTCDTTSGVKQWRLLQNPAGGVSIVNVRDGLCLVPKGGSNAAGAQAVVQACSIQPTARWEMKPAVA